MSISRCCKQKRCPGWQTVSSKNGPSNISGPLFLESRHSPSRGKIYFLPENLGQDLTLTGGKEGGRNDAESPSLSVSLSSPVSPSLSVRSLIPPPPPPFSLPLSLLAPSTLPPPCEDAPSI